MESEQQIIERKGGSYWRNLLRFMDKENGFAIVWCDCGYPCRVDTVTIDFAEHDMSERRYVCDYCEAQKMIDGLAEQLKEYR